MELGTPWDELTQETGDRKLRQGNVFQRENRWDAAAMEVPVAEELQQGTLSECRERENVWGWRWRQDQWDVAVTELIE